MGRRRAQIELRHRFHPAYDTSLIGRDRELGTPVDALDRASHQDEPQLVTLVGEPGIGKSRLVHELSLHIEAMPDLITWRQGRCLPYGDGVSYWALGEMSRPRRGSSRPTRTEAATKLDRRVAALIPEPDERGWVNRHLRPLVGLAQDRGSGDAGRAEAQGAWRRFLELLPNTGRRMVLWTSAGRTTASSASSTT